MSGAQQRRRASARGDEFAPFDDDAERTNQPPCEQADATDRNTDAIDRLVAELAQGREDFKQTIAAAVAELKPAADALEKLGLAQEKLCNFLVNNRLKLFGGIIGALLAVGVISPSAAGALRTFLASFGVLS